MMKWFISTFLVLVAFAAYAVTIPVEFPPGDATNVLAETCQMLRDKHNKPTLSNGVCVRIFASIGAQVWRAQEVKRVAWQQAQQAERDDAAIVRNALRLTEIEPTAMPTAGPTTMPTVTPTATPTP